MSPTDVVSRHVSVLQADPVLRFCLQGPVSPTQQSESNGTVICSRVSMLVFTCQRAGQVICSRQVRLKADYLNGRFSAFAANFHWSSPN